MTTVNVLDFGAKPDSTADATAAFQAAVRAAPLSFPAADGARSARVIVPRGAYRLASDLVIDRAVTLVGDGGGARAGGSRLLFSSGGVVVEGERGDVANPSGRGAHIADLSIELAPSNPSAALSLRATAAVERVYIVGGAGDGIFIDGREIVDGVRVYRNANDWRLTGCTVENAAGWGVRVRGQDCNNGLAIQVKAVSCGGGFCDSSFLGSQWIACHATACPGGGYLCDGGARSLFLGCYAEMDSWDETWISQHAVVIGASLAACIKSKPRFSAKWQEHRAFVLDSNEASHMVWRGADESGVVRTALGVDGRQVLQWQAGEDDYEHQLQATLGAWWFTRARSAKLRSLGLTRPGHALGPDHVMAERGVHLGSVPGRRVFYAATEPALTDGAPGDIALATAPTDVLDGWRRTASGWRAFVFGAAS